MIKIYTDWIAHDVKDWEELLITNTDGEKDINGATVTVLNLMPLIGITRLTDDNIGDAWKRIAIRQALLGGFIADARTEQPLFLTRTDVERHIGAQTAGDDISFHEFCEKVQEWALKDDSILPGFIANGNSSLLEWSGVKTHKKKSNLRLVT